MEVVVGKEPFGSETGYRVSNHEISQIRAANASKIVPHAAQAQSAGLESIVVLSRIRLWHNFSVL